MKEMGGRAEGEREGGGAELREVAGLGAGAQRSFEHHTGSLGAGERTDAGR